MLGVWRGTLYLPGRWGEWGVSRGRGPTGFNVPTFKDGALPLPLALYRIGHPVWPAPAFRAQVSCPHNPRSRSRGDGLGAGGAQLGATWLAGPGPCPALRSPALCAQISYPFRTQEARPSCNSHHRHPGLTLGNLGAQPGPLRLVQIPSCLLPGTQESSPRPAPHAPPPALSAHPPPGLPLRPPASSTPA